MKISFSFLLINDARFFQKIIRNVTTDWITFEVEIDVHIFSETRRIVVSVSLCIAKSFQYRIRLNKYIFNPENRMNFKLFINVVAFAPIDINLHKFGARRSFQCLSVEK